MPPFKHSVTVSLAVWEDHKEILKLSRQSPYTKTFGDVRFVQEYYTKGWIFKASQGGKIVGFACIRHCVRSPYTTIYYLGVSDSYQGRGVGRRIEREVEKSSPHEEIRLGVEEENESGQEFWRRLGFVVSGKVTTTKSGKQIHEFVKKLTGKAVKNSDS